MSTVPPSLFDDLQRTHGPASQTPPHKLLVIRNCAASKFPAGTVAGAFKTAVATNSDFDIVRFDN